MTTLRARWHHPASAPKGCVPGMCTSGSSATGVGIHRDGRARRQVSLRHRALNCGGRDWRPRGSNSREQKDDPQRNAGDQEQACWFEFIQVKSNSFSGGWPRRRWITKRRITKARRCTKAAKNEFEKTRSRRLTVTTGLQLTRRLQKSERATSQTVSNEQRRTVRFAMSE